MHIFVSKSQTISDYPRACFGISVIPDMESAVIGAWRQDTDIIRCDEFS